PGWVNGEYAQRMPPEIIEEQKAKTPLRRIAEAEDVAEAVYAVAVHLTFTTGSIIEVDGGRPLN
ncbi:MAG: SDR family oxidoreductase, partial [Chloroflexota bacterium]